MKLLSPKIHGYLDYAAVAVLFLAPTLFGFSGVAATLCYVIGATQLAMSLVTAYPLGAVKLMPFTVHAGIELATAIFLVAAPFLFGFADQTAARNFFLVSGIGLGLVWLVTNYRAVPADAQYEIGNRTGTPHLH